ncbi:MAG: pesticidal protein Cry7Aa [Bacteroidota bacterium]
MIKIKKEGIILEKTNLEFENLGVLNPAVIKEGEHVHIFYRAVQKGNLSSIGYCELEGPLKVKKRNTVPLLISEDTYESQGVEDARIVKIDDVYYMTYTAFDGVNALGSLATSTDLKNWDKKGIIVPKVPFSVFKYFSENQNVNQKYFRHARQFKPEENVFLWDKNLIFFPRRINGLLYFLHRIKPGIQIAAVNEIEELTKEYWEDYLREFKKNILLDPINNGFEDGYIGGGCPPIETESGWLIIYHGVHDTSNGYVYSACAALFELDNPKKLIARLPYPLFVPDLEWELNGVVNNVVFPTGTALFDDTLYIYYGAADQYVACASLSLAELLAELLTNKENNAN